MRRSRIVEPPLDAADMRVLIPGPLRSYTAQAAEVDGRGSTLAELVGDLDRRFTGLAFRMIDEQGHIRRHIKVFVNREQAAGLDAPLDADDEVMIVCALTGG